MSATGVTAGKATVPEYTLYAATPLDERTFAAFIPAADVAGLPATPAFGLILTRADGVLLWIRVATGTSGAAALAAAVAVWGG